jgi:hypothetical protein
MEEVKFITIIFSLLYFTLVLMWVAI